MKNNGDKNEIELQAACLVQKVITISRKKLCRTLLIRLKRDIVFIHTKLESSQSLLRVEILIIRRGMELRILLLLFI